MQSIDAEGREIGPATVRALNKTAQWLKSEGIKRVSKERKIPRKVIRNKLIVCKASRKRLRSIVKLTSEWVKVAKLGSIKQTKIGAKVGNTIYEGTFKALMRSGQGVFRRRYVTSLPVDEIEVNTHACKIIKELAESKVEKVFEEYFHQQMEQMK